MKKIFFLIISSFLFILNDLNAQVTGCTDSKALNFNSVASENDGSCIYISDTITPNSSSILENEISETSGLIKWNAKLWTHNDSGGQSIIYGLDTLNGNLNETIELFSTSNPPTAGEPVDWEEISQDSSFVYIGDFGNNISGNRKDLKILRISKVSLLTNFPIVDTIYFSYSDQTDFTNTGSNNTEFDCEAFIVSKDSIYLFTKQWISEKTKIYSLPKVPGSYNARLKSTLNVEGLITGAVYLESKNIIALSGYSKLLSPFIYLIYDFKGGFFTKGNKRKINLSLPFHQVEGITSSNGFKYYISNEYFSQSNSIQKLHIIDLTPYLDEHLSNLLSISEIYIKNDYFIYPVPASDFIYIKSKTDLHNRNYILINQMGKVLRKGKLINDNPSIDISNIQNGLYFLKIGENQEHIFNIIKR
jgi:hypothetical protein